MCLAVLGDRLALGPRRIHRARLRVVTDRLLDRLGAVGEGVPAGSPCGSVPVGSDRATGFMRLVDELNRGSGDENREKP